MQSYNENLAYDFDLFEDDTTKSKVVELPRKHTAVREDSNIKHEAANSAKTAVKMIVAAVLAVGLILLNLYCGLVSTELTAKINTAQNTVTKLESEKTRLNMEFEGIVAYDNIELAARKLGMQKQEASQTVYVNRGSEDTAVVVDKSSDKGIFSAIADLF